MRICTLSAPLSRIMEMMRPAVVPRTRESSTMTASLPSNIPGCGLSFILTPASRTRWVGWMKVRPT